MKASAGTTPTFDIVAYTGGKVNLDNVPLPVVFDLESTRIPEKSVPLLYKHNPNDIVGHTEYVQIVKPNRVIARGVASGTSERATEVKANARNGFLWQTSLGLESFNLEKIEDGKTVKVNGQVFTGPIYVARDNDLREISFVSLGADSNTFARLVASMKDTKMTFSEWLASLSIDEMTLSDSDKAIATRIYDAWKASTTATEATAEAVQAASVEAARSVRAMLAASAAARAVPVPTPVPTPTNANDVTALRASRAAEQQRFDSINSLAVEFDNPVVNGVSLAASAIRNGWDVDRTRNEMELARLRAARPTNINAGGRNGGGNGSFGTAQILEAAIAQATGLRNLERHFAAPLLDAAHTRFRGRIGLQEILLEAAYAGGYSGNHNVKGNLRAVLQAAFSTIDLPGILVNNTNKYLVEGFMSVDDSWMELAAINSVSDFKETSGYRGVGSFRFEQLGPTGQIKHGTLSETGYGNKADTYAKMFGIPREIIINDDLGYLASIPRQLGRGGALALIHAFWTEFMDNSSFFTGGNNNTSTGALSIAGLNAALTKFRKQTDENGDYVMAKPVALVVPVELEETANQLYVDTNRGGGATGDSDTNPHKGKYKPIVSPYLSDSRFTGYSTTAYYLIADPKDVPVIEVVFLDGVQKPTIETAEANFSQLGIEMRGYFDFGVRLQEYRGGVRSTGA